VEDEAMDTRVIDTDAREDEDEERWIDSESDGGWNEDDAEEALPPRARGRLLRPLPLFLVALIAAAAGFLGGVLAQKGSEGGSGGAALPGGGELPSFAAKAAGSEGGSTEGAAAGTNGLPSFGGSEAAASGTVTGVEGHTIYVKESDGTTVAVKVGDGATVTRDSNVVAKKIHPGDTVTVEGSKHGSTVKASSVAATESGVESTTGLGGLPTGTTGEVGGPEGETSVESLFEE
jgi:hypothetical protein